MNSMQSEARGFKFGENWKSFSEKALSIEAIQQARRDFETLCSGIDFHGKRFLDIGFGQGLSLCLAAEKGALCVGVDVDEVNLQALELTRSKFQLQQSPTALIGSILDEKFCECLREQGKFDIVHSWGVLHHTGNLSQALRNATSLVREGGYFIVAIYHRHWSSPAWKVIKRTYNLLPRPLQDVACVCATPLLKLAYRMKTGRSSEENVRGMDFAHDVADWIGGYPYEYMNREEILAALPQHYRILNYVPPLVPTGNHQFVFET